MNQTKSIYLKEALKHRKALWKKYPKCKAVANTLVRQMMLILYNLLRMTIVQFEYEGNQAGSRQAGGDCCLWLRPDLWFLQQHGACGNPGIYRYGSV